jgi:hypothetical protein
MRKPIQKLQILSMLLSIAIISGCKTTEIIILPPKPQRENLPPVETVQDYADVIIYYETLVQKWEAWGDSVEKIIGSKL